MRRRTIVAVALLAILVLFVGGLVIYSARALSRFERVEARRSTLLYAAPPILRPGVSVGALDLAGILSRLGYRETKTAAGAGQFSRSDAAWDIQLAGAGAGRVALSVEGGRITRLRQGGAEVQSVALPPSCWRARAPTPGRTSARYTCPRCPSLFAPRSSRPRTCASTSTAASIPDEMGEALDLHLGERLRRLTGLILRTRFEGHPTPLHESWESTFNRWRQKPTGMPSFQYRTARR